jgi:hypothetical protein
MRSSRVVRFAKPYSTISIKSRAQWGKRAYHGRLGREELEREVVRALGQSIDLIRNSLHGGLLAAVEV